MFKKLVLCSLLFIGLGFTANAQSLEEILENHFEVIGQDKILKVDNVTMKGSVAVQGGAFTLPVVMYQQRPMKTRFDATLQGQTITEAFDGKGGWKLEPAMIGGTGKPTAMTKEESEDKMEEADMDGALYNYEKKGYELELTGSEEYEGTEVHVLKLTKKDGDVDTYYMDAENFVILGMKSKRTINGTAMDFETQMSNYKEVDGMIMAYSIKNLSGGKVDSEITIEAVDYQTKIDPAVFVMPGGGAGTVADAADAVAGKAGSAVDAEIDPKAAKKAAKAAVKAKKLAEKAAKKAAKAAAKLKK